jgi:hypothetical protein
VRITHWPLAKCPAHPLTRPCPSAILAFVAGGSDAFEASHQRHGLPVCNGSDAVF